MCVCLLLEASAHVRAENLHFATPLTTSVDTGAPPDVVAVLMRAAWPDEWRMVLLMNLSIVCRALGTPRFRLFAVCRALSYQQEFYHLLRAEGTEAKIIANAKGESLKPGSAISYPCVCFRIAWCYRQMLKAVPVV